MRRRPRGAARRRRPGVRALHRSARPRRVAARRADRRVATSSASAIVGDRARDGADLGDAHRRRRRSTTSSDGSASPDATTLQLPSEFDFRTQAVLYLPPEMPDPRIAGLQPGGRVGHRRAARSHAGPRVRAVHVVRARCARCTRASRRGWAGRSSCRARRRARRCCGTSARRRTPCCSRPRASGRASTSPATR